MLKSRTVAAWFRFAFSVSGAIAAASFVSAQSAPGSYPWEDINLPVAGHRYLYSGIVRNSINGAVVTTMERTVEYTSVAPTVNGTRFVVSDRVVGNGASTNLFYDVTETRSFSAAGEELISRSTSIAGGFGSDAPTSIAYASGLIAPATFVEGRTYTYDGRFAVTSLGGNERRRVTVYPLETVTVPAGTFRCVKIGMNVDFPANVIFSAWSGTWWYARDVGVVKANWSQTSRLLRYEAELKSANFPLVAGVFEEDIRITADPESTTVLVGEPIRLRVLAEGAGLTYAWSFNGDPIPGATQPTLVIAAATVNHQGVYRATVSNAGGASRQSKDAFVAAFPVNGNLAGKLLNVSVSSFARTGEQQLIAGVSLQGNTLPHRVLIRSVGPGLQRFNVANFANNPALEVRSGPGLLLGANDDWGRTPDPSALVRAAESVGAFGLPSGSGDAALLLPLSAGGMTAAASDERGGAVLVECYDLDTDLAGGFVNLSARGDTRLSPLIVGCVTAGIGPVKLLVRGVGPSLAQFGVTDFAPAPSLRIQTGSGTATNVRWSNSAQLAELRLAMKAAGAFDLLENSADSAAIVAVPAGSVTAVIDQSSNGGIALIEVYRLP